MERRIELARKLKEIRERDLLTTTEQRKEIGISQFTLIYLGTDLYPRKTSYKVLKKIIKYIENKEVLDKETKTK
jgi:hypothetical protein